MTASDYPIIELAYEQRATWGECPVCKAPHGKACSRDIGIPMGLNVNGEIPEGSCHWGRLTRAPFRVRMVPA